MLFHGTKRLLENNLDDDDSKKGDDSSNESTTTPAVRKEQSKETIIDDNDKSSPTSTKPPLELVEEDRFLVSQEPGYATIHFGDHPHETTSLRHGSRTNIILTYVYTDPNRSDVATRSCY